MIYGIRAIIEALDEGQDLEKVFVQKNLKGELIKVLMPKLTKTDSPISKVPVEKLNQFTGKNHQGVVAFVSPVKYHDLPNLLASTFEQGKTPFFLVLDRVTDVRNFGAIARSAEALGAHGIVIPTKNAAQINADSMKTSAGALTKIPVCRVPELSESINYLQSSGCQIIACSEKGDRAVYGQQLHDPIALIFGSEEDGISKEIVQYADAHVKIPLNGKIASLNVSAAVAICLYEVVRQRG
jgi:23S rRNA (guanosine2251-2'-O)-methyltransferase